MGGRQVLGLVHEHVAEGSEYAPRRLLIEPGGRQGELLGEGGHAQVGSAVPVPLDRPPHGGALAPVEGDAPPRPPDAQVLLEGGDTLRQHDHLVLGLQEVGGPQPLGSPPAHKGENLLPHIGPGVGEHLSAGLAG